MTVPRLALLLALLPVLAACDSFAPITDTDAVSVNGVSLSLDREVVRRGEAARLTLRNDGNQGFETGVLDCALLQRWDGQAWVTAESSRDRVCILLLLSVSPGEALSERLIVDEPRGTYRFIIGEGERVIATASFLVAG